MTANSWAHRRRLLLFLLASLAIFAFMYVLYSAISTLQQLDVIEAERDRWQRPSDVLAALNLREGSTVADVGSGAGYFALKLSMLVGEQGKVQAIDLRRLSLSFLWIRSLLRGAHNIGVVVGEPDDPHLAAESMDAVLIANTYHEFTNGGVMLDHVFRSLRAGGRLVIVDRGPHMKGDGHGLTAEVAERDLRAHGFQILSENDAFIQREEGDVWWLLVARKSSTP